ncbi:hypothetical protein D9M72_302470 [compost metagenome]
MFQQRADLREPWQPGRQRGVQRRKSGKALAQAFQPLFPEPRPGCGGAQEVQPAQDLGLQLCAVRVFHPFEFHYQQPLPAIGTGQAQVHAVTQFQGAETLLQAASRVVPDHAFKKGRGRLQGVACLLHGERQQEPPAASRQTKPKPIRPKRQHGRHDRFGQPPARLQRLAVATGKLQLLVQGVRRYQGQAHAGRLVMVPMETLQRGQERGGFQLQAGGVAGMKIRQRVTGRQSPCQRGIAEGLAVPRAGAVLGLQHLPLTPEGSGFKRGMGQHVQQPRQGLLEAGRRYLAEEARAAWPGTRIDPSAQALDERNQTLLRRISAATQKHQMFEKVGQPRILAGFVVAAALYLHQHCAKPRAGPPQQAQLQAIGQARGQ